MLTLAQALAVVLQGRTQDQAAKLIGASARSIRRWKAGHAKPSFRKLDRLIERAEIDRRLRIKRGAPKVTVVPTPIKTRVMRTFEDFSTGKLILIQRKITQVSYDLRGLSQADIAEVLMWLQKKKKEVRFFLRMPQMVEDKRYRNRTGSTGWTTLKHASRAAIERFVLRTLQTGDIETVTIGDQS